MARRLSAAPALLRLLSDALSTADGASVAELKAISTMTPWLTRTLEAGQAAGAVRTDLPAELLLAVMWGSDARRTGG